MWMSVKSAGVSPQKPEQIETSVWRQLYEKRCSPLWTLQTHPFQGCKNQPLPTQSYQFWPPNCMLSPLQYGQFQRSPARISPIPSHWFWWFQLLIQGIASLLSQTQDCSSVELPVKKAHQMTKHKEKFKPPSKKHKSDSLPVASPSDEMIMVLPHTPSLFSECLKPFEPMAWCPLQD